MSLQDKEIIIEDVIVETTLCDTEIDKSTLFQTLNHDKILKQRSLQIDINDFLFVETIFVKPCKRKGKISELPYEDISFDVYQQKKCGFLTKRPLEWAKAIENYINETRDVEARWEYKMEKEKYSECEIILYVDKTKKVLINIFVRSGVITVKGDYFREWMNTAFQKLREYIYNNCTDVVNNTTTYNKDETNQEGGIYENTNDINKLWEEYTSLKAGLATLEKSVENIVQSHVDVSELIDRNNKSMEQKIKSLELSYDNKLAVFMSAVSDDCQHTIIKNLTSIKDDVLCHKKYVSKIESRFQKSINQIQKDNNNYSCLSTENTPKWSDFEALKHNTISGQQSALNDIDDLKIKSENLEFKLMAMRKTVNAEQKTTNEITNPKNFTNDINLLTSRCNSLEANVNSLVSAKVNVKQKSTTDDIAALETCIVTIASRCDTIDAKVNSLASGSIDTPITRQITCLQEKIKLVEHNINTKPSYSQRASSTVPIANPHAGDNTTNLTAHELKTPQVTEDHDTTLLICMDSNMKFVDHKRFWKEKGTAWKRCTRLEHIENVFSKESFTNLQAVLISCGVNEMDKRPGKEVAEHIIHIIMAIKATYPSVKIILGEATPRNDDRDIEVRKCNEALAHLIKNINESTFVKHDNLRDPEWSCFHDAKHIKKNEIPKFVINLKQGLRSALGVPVVANNTNHNLQINNKSFGNKYLAHPKPQGDNKIKSNVANNLTYSNRNLQHRSYPPKLDSPYAVQPMLHDTGSRSWNQHMQQDNHANVNMLPQRKPHNSHFNENTNSYNGDNSEVMWKQKILHKISEALRDL